MDPVYQLMAERDITFVMHEYARFLDLNRPDDQANTFATDGVADYAGTDIVGRQAIADLLRPAHNRYVATTFSISNMHIELTSETTATARSYVLSWQRTNPSGEGDKEARGQYHDEWKLTDEGWRIARRTFLAMATTPASPDARGIGRTPRTQE